MGLLDKLRGEFVDIVEWVDDSAQTLLWRFPRYNNEIKHGAQLIVRPGQVALFVSSGKLADVFEPGQYTLETKNLPLLSTLQGWKFGFESPFKAEVYFVSTRQITGLKWGTPNPIMLRDADFGPVRLRAFGTYTLKTLDPKALIRELTAAHATFEAAEIGELLRSLIVTAFSEIVGSSKIAAMDLAGNLSALSDKVRTLVCERIDDEYGLVIPQLLIVNVSLPEEVEKAMDTRSSIGVLGDLQRFNQYQMGQAVLQAAQNPSAGAGQAMALGAGLAMGQQMLGQMQANAAPPAGAAFSAPQPLPPAPPASGALFHVTFNGQTFGPYAVVQITQAVTQGQMNAQTLVWCAGMAGWAAAGSVPALAACFGPPPPPPPPPSGTP